MFYRPKTVKWEIRLGTESNDTAAKFSRRQLSPHPLSDALHALFGLRLHLCRRFADRDFGGQLW